MEPRPRPRPKERPRAFVVRAGAPVAEIDLQTLHVRYHSLSEPISFLGRLHDWLEPEAEAKTIAGPARQAFWLGNGLLAVTGSDNHATTGPGGEQQWETAAGLKLIDTRNWSIRTLHSNANRATLVDDMLLVTGLVWDSRSRRFAGAGLTAYSLDGARRYHLYGDEPISGVQPVGSRIIVGGAAGSTLFHRGALLDASSGRQIRRVTLNVTLLVGDQPFWY